eukprot:2897007-Prymnesium_polylepis.1
MGLSSSTSTTYTRMPVAKASKMPSTYSALVELVWKLSRTPIPADAGGSLLARPCVASNNT